MPYSKRMFSGLVLLIVLVVAVAPIYAQQDVSAYYPAWRQWTFPAEDIDFSVVTEIRHAFGWPDITGSLVLDEGVPYPDLISEAEAHGVPVLLSLGGSSHSTFFPSTLSNASLRANFISDIVDACQQHGYSGVDIDYEFPSSASDKLNLTIFVAELRASFNGVNPDWRITMAVPAGTWWQQHFDLASMASLIDSYSVMAYDFNGWNEVAGHNAPLWSDPLSDCDNGSAADAIDELLATLDVPASKLQLGLPFYGRRYVAGWLCDSTDVAEYTVYEDIVPYFDSGWTRVMDEVSGVPLLWSPGQTQFFSYDDSVSIAAKVDFALDRELGGVMIWALGQDRVGDRQVLLETIANGLGVAEGETAIRPTRMELSPPRPNPFNSSTRIGFTLPRSERVAVDVYNVHGQWVQRLVRGVWAAGHHELSWSPSQLPSGVYFIQLRGEFGAPMTRKAVLLR